jgi:hypothetical protein
MSLSPFSFNDHRAGPPEKQTAAPAVTRRRGRSLPDR